jgi:hypothetical protein
VKAALAGLAGVTLVEHEAGTDVFVVQHRGPLSGAARAVDRVVILRWARRALEGLVQQMRAALRHRR